MEAPEGLLSTKISSSTLGNCLSIIRELASLSLSPEKKEKKKKKSLSLTRPGILR
jgi:hypothetical protein